MLHRQTRPRRSHHPEQAHVQHQAATQQSVPRGWIAQIARAARFLIRWGHGPLTTPQRPTRIKTPPKLTLPAPPHAMHPLTAKVLMRAMWSKQRAQPEPLVLLHRWPHANAAPPSEPVRVIPVRMTTPIKKQTHRPRPRARPATVPPECPRAWKNYAKCANSAVRGRWETLLAIPTRKTTRHHPRRNLKRRCLLTVKLPPHAALRLLARLPQPVHHRAAVRARSAISAIRAKCPLSAHLMLRHRMTIKRHVLPLPNQNNAQRALRLIPHPLRKPRRNPMNVRPGCSVARANVGRHSKRKPAQIRRRT